MTCTSPLEGLKVGCVAYLNSRPLIYGAEHLAAFMHPSALARELFAGRLDVALVPVFEALAHPGYLAVDGVGIVGRGEVYSVAMAHTCEIAEISTLALDPASMTSANLCQVILKEFYRIAPKIEQWDGNTPPRGDRAVLMIGDQAIRFRQTNPDAAYLDLAEAWQRFTGLPFVFAIWLARPDVKRITEIAEGLRALKRSGLEHLKEICEKSTDYDYDFVVRYLGGYVQYDVGAPEREAIARYGTLLAKYGLIPQPPSLLDWV